MKPDFYVQKGPDGYITKKELDKIDREQRFRKKWRKWLNGNTNNI